MLQSQTTNVHRLNFTIIDNIRKQLGICHTFIDLFDWKSYKGTRHIVHGRIISVPNDRKDNLIIIDKDHTTRYLVERIISTIPNRANKEDPEYKRIQAFEGYKMQHNKYMIHGIFNTFEMTHYYAYFGFEQINLASQQYSCFTQVNISKQYSKAQLLFCKVNTEVECVKYYFDLDLQQIKKITIMRENSSNCNDYFSEELPENILNKLKNNDYVSTRTLNYFFNRIMYSYYSQFWFKGTNKLIKVFPSHKIINFFSNSTKNLGYTFFSETMFDIYENMNICMFDEQELIIFPIFEYGKEHFVLGAIKKKQKNLLKIFEFDPLDSQGGTWRNRLQLFVFEYIRIMNEKGVISCNIEIQKQTKIDYLQAPRQHNSVDCGIFICLYALLLMDKNKLICIEQIKQKCKDKEGTIMLIGFIRHLLYSSYQYKNTYFLDSISKGFKEAFEHYLLISNHNSKN